MALPDTIKRAQGTPVVWGTASGAGVTAAILLDALASAAGRMGVAVDLGALWNQEYACFFVVETGTAPTAGLVAECYLACSWDNSTWPGKVSGADAAYPSTVSANKKALGPPASILVATNDTNTTLRQAPTIWRPTGRYVAPVVINLLGQAFRDQTTASDNTSRVILVPLIDSIED